MNQYGSTLLLILLLNLPSFAWASALNNWIGEWKGSCQLNPAYAGVSTFDFSLTIEQNATGPIKWQLVNEASGRLPRQVRDYTLTPVDASKGHYAIDENNGLLLDAYIDKEMVYVPYTINGLLITNTYVLLNDAKMLVDLPSFGATPVRKTCLKGNSSLCTESFALQRGQRCVLTKTKSGITAILEKALSQSERRCLPLYVRCYTSRECCSGVCGGYGVSACISKGDGPKID